MSLAITGSVTARGAWAEVRRCQARRGRRLTLPPGSLGILEPIARRPRLAALIGALAIFGLLPQKSGLADSDYELFELLATQGAAALHNSGLHSSCAEEGASA